jgi:hypothetical protein
MNNDDQLISSDDNNANESSQLNRFFSLLDTGDLCSTEALLCNDYLEKLVFHISRKPKSLITHVQRIYYCFHMQLDEQLYAALVDFLVILNRQGKEISWRMVTGAKSRLSSKQFTVLNNYLSHDDADINLLPGNQFSIFTKGLAGINHIIEQTITHEEPSHDPLAIARDYIEYSQLEEAKHFLEKAVLEQPARLDLHHELLAIYKSMRDAAGFKRMLAELTQSGFAVPDEWVQLNDYFKGQNSDG